MAKVIIEKSAVSWKVVKYCESLCDKCDQKDKCEHKY